MAKKLDKIDKLINEAKTTQEIMAEKEAKREVLADKLERLKVIMKGFNDERKVLLNRKLSMVGGKFVKDDSIELRAELLQNEQDNVLVADKRFDIYQEWEQLNNEIEEHKTKGIQAKIGGVDNE